VSRLGVVFVLLVPVVAGADSAHSVAADLTISADDTDPHLHDAGDFSGSVDARVTAYADRFRVSASEAERQLAVADAAGQLAERIARAWPADFAGAWVEHEPSFRVVIAFARDAPPAAVQDVNAALSSVGARGSDLLIDTGAGRSLEDLFRQADAVRASITSDERISAVIAPNIMTGTISVTVAAPDYALPATVRAPNVSLVVNGSTLAAGGEHTYGGGKLSTCTTGFSATRAGVSGVITAGHCGSTQTYTQDDGVSYAAPYVTQHRGAWGDFQFHTTSHDEYDDYYYNWGVRADVGVIRSEGSQLPGSYICLFGRSSGQVCDTIYTYNVTATFDGISHQRLVAMYHHWTTGGDSGGPWFAGNEAWGIHSGYAKVDGLVRSTYSMAAFADEAIAATVKIS
jgi:hypothetical protein